MVENLTIDYKIFLERPLSLHDKRLTNKYLNAVYHSSGNFGETPLSPIGASHTTLAELEFIAVPHSVF